MRLVGRLLMIALGLFAANSAGSALFGAYLMLPHPSAGFEGGVPNYKAQGLVSDFLMFAFASTFGLMAALLPIGTAEAFNIRRAISYVIGGAVSGLVGYLVCISYLAKSLKDFPDIVNGRQLALMVCIGLLSGLVYWAIAGRNAGAWRRRYSLAITN